MTYPTERKKEHHRLKSALGVYTLVFWMVYIYIYVFSGDFRDITWYNSVQTEKKKVEQKTDVFNSIHFERLGAGPSGLQN